ncbi:exopolysaccharide biosynthesis protein [Roseivirga sp.]|uniref:exopolysaccharide biosynthesis protein n=1 Tax=Roseivirga sp. TaxID=1964215 RepID=UPI002B26C594|nr:exopolysaccharide biosynthesis protein [Roseivirga sp.]
MSEHHHINEERISIAGLIRNFQAWAKAMFSVWAKIILGAIVIGGLFFTYQLVRKINYKAETTFTLEDESGGGLGQLSSLASLAGVNVGSSLGGESSLFQLDNITELYMSYTMMKETLLTKSESEMGVERLITWYGRENKLDKKWAKAGVNFEMPKDNMIVRHDSVLKEVVKDIRKRNLVVSKPSRKLTILSVAYTSNDELFSKKFNETLVQHVNEFYKAVKTKKTSENLRVLAYQADSVKKVLDQSLSDLAQFDERNPYLNSLKSMAYVPRQKIMIDVQASSAVYEEIVKNLEIAKISNRNNTPLIQGIDKPVLPLEDDHMKWYKALVIGLVLGGLLMVSYFTLMRIYTSVMSQED